MIEVNLLPPEILQRQKVRQMTYAVMGAGAVVILLVVAFYVLQGTRLSGVNSDIDDQNANNQGIQAQISGLADGFRQRLLDQRSISGMYLLDERRRTAAECLQFGPE